MLHINYQINIIYILKMIKYWPNQQGIRLNKTVINIFYCINKKLINNLTNNTKCFLYIDILDSNNKHKIMTIVLQEFKLLLLDLIELNLPLHDILNMKSQIILDLTEQAQKKFITKKELYFNNNQLNPKSYIKNIYLQQNLLIEYILIYFLFGSSFIPYEIFPFNNLYTPQEHVQVLLENFIIQLSNLIIFQVLDPINELTHIQYILQKYKLCNTNYLATRSIAVFKNNLDFQSITEFYLDQPRAIYSSKYKVLLISSQGIITKYIFISRIHDLQKLSKIQLSLLLLLEIQDIIIPKIENSLLITIKIIFYTFINVCGNSLIILIRVLINQIKNNS
uniref:Transmembrane protein n=1 Tax=Callithamnion tetricum TaxID=193179 RepID=A0A4D6WNE3_9FLOR|nr:hypothetical protein [Callithamnion tetricum]